MRDFHMLVCRYGLDPRVVHRAFLEIEEFRAIMGAMADDTIDLGRETASPRLRVFQSLGAVHVWPSFAEAAMDIPSTERLGQRLILPCNSLATTSNDVGRRELG
jgi:hypothetical protein